MLRNGRAIALSLFLIVVVIGLVGGLTWANLYFTHRYIGGQDFVGLWKGAQNLLMQGVTPYGKLTFLYVTPYGELTTINIQSLVYGRAAVPGEDPLRVNQPFYFVLLFIPFGMIQDLYLARAIWMTLLEIGLVGLIILSIQLSQWKPGVPSLFFVFLFGMLWMPGLQSLVRGNAIILQSLLIFGTLRALEMDLDEFAGALLVFTLFQFEATGFLLVVLFAWITYNRRWRVWGGFLMLLAVFLGIGFILLPNWPIQFIQAIIVDWQGLTAPTTYTIITDWFPGLGFRIAQVITIGSAILLAIEWFTARDQNTRWLFWTLCLTAVVTPLVGLPYRPYWMVPAIPAVILMLSVIGDRWGTFGKVLAYLITLGVFVGFWFFGNLPAIGLLGFPIVMVILLYWIRWWAISRPRLWVDTVPHME